MNWKTIVGIGSILASVVSNGFCGDLTISSFSAFAGQSNIVLQAAGNIEFTGGALALPGLPAGATVGQLTVQAGNNIVVDDGSSISVGANWKITLVAGTALSGAAPSPGNDGIYLNGSAYIQSQNGDISLVASNEVVIDPNSTLAGNNGIRTLNGGSISVMAQFGDVNAGGNLQGFVFNNNSSPYYSVSPFVGGISTAAGGNVTIQAGGSVYSYTPFGTTATDPGTGAFGPQPGNLTITAGAGVYGHYVVANGLGRIMAGTDVGTFGGPTAFALSLIAGTCTVSAPNGNIYLQEVRNPNGVFNTLVKSVRGQPADLAGKHLFDYDSNSSVVLNAGIGVYLTDLNLPRPDSASASLPVLLPPQMTFNAGSGGVNLAGSLTVFPSVDQNLSVTTTGGGGLSATTLNGLAQYELLMSDSAKQRWTGATDFSDTDHGPLSAEPTDPTPVSINVSGDMEDLNLITTKETYIAVGGNMAACGFSGQNLHANDVSTIRVTGQLANPGAYAYVNGIVPALVPTGDLPAGISNSWDAALLLAVNPSSLAGLQVPGGVPPSQWLDYAVSAASAFGTVIAPSGQLSLFNSGFVYDAVSHRLGYGGQMPASWNSALSGPVTVLRLTNGTPMLDSTGHFVTDNFTWVPAVAIQTLYTASQTNASPFSPQVGYRIGGPGQLNVTAGSISLGNASGILSCGVFEPASLYGRYTNLAAITPSGADVNVSVAGDLDLPNSTIASLGGGNVNVTSSGAVNLRNAGITAPGQLAYGIFTAGAGNVNVLALKNISIGGAQIATYDGGNIFVESLASNIDIGGGGVGPQANVFLDYVVNTNAAFYFHNGFPGSGSGIVATTPVPGELSQGYPPPGASVPLAGKPGDITVWTPQGNISCQFNAIFQAPSDGSLATGSTINLTAGSPGYNGNINLGFDGIIGGAVIANAQFTVSDILGHLVSEDYTLGGNTVNVTAQGSVESLSGPPEYMVPGPVSIVGTNLQPVVHAMSGTDVEIQVPMQGTAPINYQWSKNGTNILGATNDVLALTNVHRSDEGTYSLAVSNSAAATEYVFQLRILAPEILGTTLDPISGTVHMSLHDPNGELPTGVDSGSFVVQSSTNLVDWSAVGVTIITNQDGSLRVDAPISPGAPNVFYRVVSQ